MIVNLTRMMCKRPHYGNYSEVEKYINKDVVITYFYPSLDRTGRNPLIPEYTDEGIKYGDTYSESQFEKIFIHSFGQTAIEPSSLTAEDGSLHETEYISPVVEEENQSKSVYFVGYLIVKNNSDRGKIWKIKDSSPPNLRDVMREISVGGEKRYGFGRLRLLSFSPLGDEGRVFGFQITEKKERVCITIPKGKPISAHLAVNDDLKIKGDLEPLVGWELKSDGYKLYQLHNKYNLFWIPGSITEEDLEVKFERYGILVKR